MTKRRTKVSTPAAPVAAPPPDIPRDGGLQPWFFLPLLTVMIFTSFLPLLKYFFAQDDFVLMLDASTSGFRALYDYFGANPGQFRPLSKVVYFAVVYPLFGMNATPYHIVSFLFHITNTILVYAFLRRVRTGLFASLSATSLFGLSVTFFHVLGWVSCIQQLMAQCFMLLSLIYGIDSLDDGHQRRARNSLVFYVCAMLSMEQAYAVPIILAAYAWLAPAGDRKRLPALEAVLRFRDHFLVLAAYFAFMVLWKTLPREGPYEVAFGPNVLKNLGIYVGWMYQFTPVLSSSMNSVPFAVKASHVLFLLVLGYHIVLGRFRKILFGLLYTFVTLLPLLFFRDHTFYLHTYVPSLGMLYLVALVLNDIEKARVLWKARARPTLLLFFMLLVFGLSFVQVRKNEKSKMRASSALARSFVLRRAMIAETMYKDIQTMEHEPENIRRLFLVYGREEARDRSVWNDKNVQAALGHGAALKLFYKNPQLDVEFKVVGDKLRNNQLENARIFFYNDFGNIYAYADTTRSDYPGE